MGRGALYKKVWNLRPAFESAEVARLSLETLAERLGCSRSHLYRLQKGTRTPSRVIAERLADAAKMPVEALIVGAVGPDSRSEETTQTPSGVREDAQVR